MTEISSREEIEVADPLEIPARRAETQPVSAERVLAAVRVIWAQRQLVYRATMLGAVLATAAAFLMAKRFESTIRLMPPDSPSSSTAMLAVLSGKAGPGLGGVAGDLLGMKSSGDLFVGILQSRTVEDRLVDRFRLRKVYRVRLGQDARRKLAANTAISQDRKSGIITITVADRDPQRAAAMGQAYVEELNRLVTELSTSGAHRERVFLEERLKTVQQDLESAEKEFSQFASKNMAIDIKEQGRAMVEAAAKLQGELIAAQSELQGLRQIYTDNNVRVRSVQARIAELKQEIEKFGGKGETGAPYPPAAEASLYPSIKKLPLLGVNYADMYRRTKVQETVLEVLTQQYELAKVEEVRVTPSIKVLDPANVPEKKSFPPRLLIMALGTLLSCAFSIAWILACARWQQMDANHPGKAVVEEILSGARTHLVEVSQKGSRPGWVTRRTMRFQKSPEQKKEVDGVQQQPS